MLATLRRLLEYRFRQFSPAPTSGRVAPGSRQGRPRLLFAFHGGNRPWPGVGQKFYREEAAFRRAIRHCGETVERRMGFSLSDVFEGREGLPAGGLEENERRNIVILSAVELALCDLWRARGVEPDAAVGISGGEVAAAYAAGALTLEESAEVLCSVALLVTQKPRKGHFVWLDVDFEKALQLTQTSPVRLDVFLEMSPLTSLAYCTSADFDDAERFLSGLGVGYRAAETDWAHHTPWAEEALGSMAGKLYEPRPRPLSCPLYSPVTGDIIPAGAVLGADYWYRAAVTPIMFGRATCAALADGHEVILNVCNHPTLRAGLEQSAEAVGERTLMLDTMRRGEPELATRDEAFRSLRSRGLIPTRRGSAVRGEVSTLKNATDADNINLLRPDVVRNPYPHYAVLRRNGPVHFLKQHGFWLALNYDDVVRAFKQPAVFSSATASAQFDPVLIQADPPAHTRARRILSPYFSPHAVQALEDYTRSCAEKLLARGGEAGGLDLVGEFAAPLTELVLSRFLGIPHEETRELRRELSAHKYQMEESSRILDEWARKYVARLEASPGEDLCSRLLRGEGEERLAPGEVASVMKLLWDAGTVTTSMLIATSALLLLRHPHVRAEAREDPRVLPAFVDEALRFEAPDQLATRVTREEVELSGVLIPAGAVVKLCIAAANRDPAHFAEPDRISLRRSPNQHLSFAAGPHFCLGAMLARMEARVALETLLAAWPNFGPARPLATVSYAESIQFRALKSLFIKAA